MQAAAANDDDPHRRLAPPITDTHQHNKQKKHSQHCAGDAICVVSVVRPVPHAVLSAAPPVQYEPLGHAVQVVTAAAVTG